MKTKIKKRPIWQAFQEIFGEAYENAATEVSDYFEEETRQIELGNPALEIDTAKESLAFDKAWDKAFDYGKVKAVIRERFDIAFEAAESEAAERAVEADKSNP